MLEDQERPMLVVLRNSPIIILAGFVKTHLLKITARLYGKRHKGKSVASDQRNNRAGGQRSWESKTIMKKNEERLSKAIF